MTRPPREPGDPEVSVTVCPDGPLLVHGRFEMVGEDGATVEHRGPVVLCRCGRSGSRPFCDASHKVGKPV